MSEINEHIYSLILAQLSGNATEAELSELEQWLKSDKANGRLYSEVKNTYWCRPNTDSEEKRNQVFNRIKQQIDIPTPQVQVSNKGRGRRLLLTGIAAASVVFALMLGWWMLNDPQQETEIAQLEKFCPRGKKLHFQLPDGSEVWLNADSKLLFPEKFTGAKRSIKLQGEAFFKVKRNVDQPFVVSTQNAVIQVLGTSFNINSRNGNSSTYTTVVSGKVRVSDLQLVNSVDLVKNQHVSISPDGAVGAISVVNANELTGWTNNILFFDDVSLAEVIVELERWYDMDFEVKDSVLLTKQVRAKFENPSIDQILDHISSVLSFNYTIEEGKVLIKSEL